MDYGQGENDELADLTTGCRFLKSDYFNINIKLTQTKHSRKIGNVNPDKNCR